MNKIIILLLFFILTFINQNALSKNLPIPRFVTIKFTEVNVRTAPKYDCPIEWIFVKKGEPVEVIAEYGQWHKIRDINSEGGWVHSSVISKKRTIIIVTKNTIPLIEPPAKYDKIVARLKPQIRCSLHKCKNDWCLISCKFYKGWVAKNFLWGIYSD